MKNDLRWQYETLFLCFLLLIFTYSATLQFDFAVLDQYRAFRLPESFTKLEEFNTCVRDALPFYFRSGRPIVWIAECVERAFVGKLGDFYFFRFLPLATTLFFVFLIGKLYSHFSGCRIFALQMCGLVLSILPGYQFFLLLGTNGLMVLFAPILSIASSYYFVIRSDLGVRRFAPSLTLYILSCYIYPAWALSVVPFSLFLIVVNEENSLKNVLKKSVIAMLFYFLGTALYFFSIKLFISLNLFNSAAIAITANYDTNVVSDVVTIFSRLHIALEYVFFGPVWDVNHIGLVILVSGFLSLIYIFYSKFLLIDGGMRQSFVIRIMLVFIIVIPIYFISIIAPMGAWLLSSMNELSQRFFNYSFAMPVLSTVYIVDRIFSINKKIATFILLIVIPGMFIFANKVVTLNVIAYAVEIDYMKHKISNWIDSGSYLNDRTVVVIPPYANKTDSRPAFMRSLATYHENYRTGAWSGELTHYFELFSAIIREKQNHEIGRKMNLINCPLYESNCLFDIKNKDSIIFYVLNRDDLSRQVLRIPTNPLILDASSLTANPVEISISITPPIWPEVKSTSFNQYDASGLLGSVSPGWHAERNPRYPQMLQIDFKQTKQFDSVYFLPQDEKLVARAPKKVRIRISRDGKSWRTIAHGDDMCSANSPGGWYKLSLPNKVEVRHLEIDIISNCGDPDFLTLRGLKFE